MPVNFKSESQSQPTVFIIDDDDGVCDSLAKLINSMGIYTRSFNDVNSFLDEYDSCMPGCLVLDIRLPRISGLELQEHLLRQGIRIPIIFLSGHSNVAIAVKTMKAGAIDFMEKPFDEQILLDSIQRAIEIDRKTREEMLWHIKIMERLVTLSPREEEVFRLLLQGKSNKIIANTMNLSTKTIETHRAHIMHKLGVNSMAGLAWMAITSGEYREIPDQLPFTPPDTNKSPLHLL